MREAQTVECAGAMREVEEAARGMRARGAMRGRRHEVKRCRERWQAARERAKVVRAGWRWKQERQECGAGKARAAVSRAWRATAERGLLWKKRSHRLFLCQAVFARMPLQRPP